jgi:hypothetical protein
MPPDVCFKINYYFKWKYDGVSHRTVSLALELDNVKLEIYFTETILLILHFTGQNLSEKTSFF